MNIIWESIILTFTGIIVLKMTGSTSVSQMTRAEIIIVVSIGRIIVEPVLSRKVVPSIFAISYLQAYYLSFISLN